MVTAGHHDNMLLLAPMIAASFLVHEFLDDLDLGQQQSQRSEDQRLDCFDLDEEQQPLGQDEQFAHH
jgi:hypothetical protein